MKLVIRVSFAGSTGAPGSFHGRVILPSPFVSRTVGHQPCEARSSPPWSNFFVFNQPMTLVSPLNQSVSSLPNCR
ncbi:MAG: hypothetical protein DMF90_01165 [Acidobacteria bacterium]|nr:MAG: hypothetical protein DMF90_01165 [Acidobacteriota bacterium]